MVESGNYCKRTNINNIDPNRNWNIGWGKDISNSAEEGPGTKPFSEVESTFAKDSIAEFSPDVFLTVHSGVYGLFYPYASKKVEAEHIEPVKRVLREIKSKFCPLCSLGPPSKLIGYISPGNCLDYSYEILKVPHTMAWEIYTNEYVTDLELERIRNKEKSQSSINSDGAVNLDSIIMSSFLELGVASGFMSRGNLKYKKPIEAEHTREEKDTCLNLFNPNDHAGYQYIILKWNKALIYMVENLAKAERRKN